VGQYRGLDLARAHDRRTGDRYGVPEAVRLVVVRMVRQRHRLFRQLDPDDGFQPEMGGD